MSNIVCVMILRNTGHDIIYSVRSGMIHIQRHILLSVLFGKPVANIRSTKLTCCPTAAGGQVIDTHGVKGLNPSTAKVKSGSTLSDLNK